MEVPILTTLLLVGTALLARAQAQGFEQALFATAIEYGAGAVRSTMRFLSVAGR